MILTVVILHTGGVNVGLHCVCKSGRRYFISDTARVINNDNNNIIIIVEVKYTGPESTRTAKNYLMEQKKIRGELSMQMFKLVDLDFRQVKRRRYQKNSGERRRDEQGGEGKKKKKRVNSRIISI